MRSHIDNLLTSQIVAFKQIFDHAEHFEKLLLKHGLPLPVEAVYFDAIDKKNPEYLRLRWNRNGIGWVVTIYSDSICINDYGKNYGMPFDCETEKLHSELVAAIRGGA